jgi:hypothetical protein
MPRLLRYSRGRAWAICVLEFKGRRRQQWAPNRLTELYFLDEATGLAAGHRPVVHPSAFQIVTARPSRAAS